LQAAHFCLALTNLFCAIRLKQKEAVEYLGQVNMLALITILLIIPLHVTNQYLPVSAAFNNTYLAFLSVFTIKLYIKRMKYAGIIGNHGWVVVINIISLAIFFTYLIT
jgi:hypothetical protein